MKIPETMPKIMGILNATPDSHYIHSRNNNLQSAINYGLDLWRQGADLIDIGGESTRPGAEPVSEEEELCRVIPLIQELTKLQPLPISIDTLKPEVARQALIAGASLINDITGFQDPAMREIAASSTAQICVMHMQGNPKTMQQAPHYPDGVVDELLRWFGERLKELARAGIKESQIILDPGIGFGKNIAHNLEIIHNLPKFKALGFPILLGLSRKSFMQKILDLPATELLPATLTMNQVGIMAGVDYLRVYDVKEQRQAIDILKALQTTAIGA